MCRIMLLSLVMLLLACVTTRSDTINNLPNTGVGINDCSAIVMASGGTFYPISASGSYPDGCRVVIVNNDPMPDGVRATGAKFIPFASCTSGFAGTYLFPTQSMEVLFASGTWVPLRCPGEWEMPAGLFEVLVDPTNGSDEWGVADGLDDGARSFHSLNGALYFISELMRANGSTLPTTVNVKLCSGCIDTNTVHWAPHGSISHMQGGHGLGIDCNGGSPGFIQLYWSILNIQNCKIISMITLQYSAVLLISDGNTFVPIPNQPLIYLNGESVIYNNASNGVKLEGGTGGGLIAMQSGFVMLPAIEQEGNVTWTQAGLTLVGPSYVVVSGWTSNGYTTTGLSYTLGECATIDNTRFIPGDPGIASCNQKN
jgi:hypothetical protein